MIPTPMATRAPAPIQIGATRLSTPVHMCASVVDCYSDITVGMWQRSACAEQHRLRRLKPVVVMADAEGWRVPEAAAAFSACGWLARAGDRTLAERQASIRCACCAQSPAAQRLDFRTRVFEGPSHAFGDERRERRDIHVDACPIQS